MINEKGLENMLRELADSNATTILDDEDATANPFNNNDDPPFYSDHNDRNDVEGQDVLHFIGFLAWYTFLVLCCILPTFCAFKRRRRYERRLQRELFLQQMASIQLQMQLQEEAEAVVDEEVQKERRRCIQIAVSNTTMMLTESDLVNQKLSEGESDLHQQVRDDIDDNNNNDDNSIDQHQDESTYVQLHPNVVNGNRLVPGSCAICLCPYLPEDRITHSPHPGCSHAFHETCIVEWLSKKCTRLCPCCRQEFCPEVDPAEIVATNNGTNHCNNNSRNDGAGDIAVSAASLEHTPTDVENTA